jgi:hypothetical protein
MHKPPNSSSQIDSQAILYSPGANDECYTPAYAVRPLFKYIPIGQTVWCPFDKASSQFVQLLRAAGIDITHSHIEDGQDFYTYEPPKWDILISNPPFTNKRAIFQRALSFNKPFCLLMSLTGLNDSAPKQLFQDRDLQLLMFDKRIQYDNQKKITFSSAYYCWNFLPKQIIMETLPKG